MDDTARWPLPTRSAPEVQLCEALLAADGPMTRRQLADVLTKRYTSITKLVRRLIRLGIVEPADRPAARPKGNCIQLTTTGKNATLWSRRLGVRAIIALHSQELDVLDLLMEESRALTVDELQAHGVAADPTLLRRLRDGGLVFDLVATYAHNTRQPEQWRITANGMLLLGCLAGATPPPELG